MAQFFRAYIYGIEKFFKICHQIQAMGNSTSNTTTESESVSSTGTGAIVVYGILLSPNTQRVLLALEEKNLTYNFENINFMQSEHKVKENNTIATMD